MAISSISSTPQSAYSPQTSPQPTDSSASTSASPSLATPTASVAAAAQAAIAGKPDLDAPAATPSPESNIKINPDGTTGPLHKHNHATQSVRA
jgi:hypothetical protein